MENKEGLQFITLLVRAFVKDGGLVGIEVQEGQLKRYKTEEMTNGDSNELFGIISARN